MRKLKSGLDFTDYPENGFRYKVVSGDLYRCLECGVEVFGDFGSPFTSKRKKSLLFVKGESEGL